ncbi:IgGFc-binding protein [Parabacteroides sp. PF5-9]|uniref:IgGFc-binding protein n=1 Tax=Parabacteroides sp. PF5-9 TaxID=1742404 RepID=UPI002476FE8A|nr:IgGFc-binding protein [Parabacteroides sp. PF5-9]
MRTFFLILIATTFSLSLYAQNSATEGKEFYVTFTSNNGRTGTAVDCQIRYIVAESCYITTQYGDGTYLDNNVLYTPGVYTKDVDKDKCYIEVASSGSSNEILKITSTKNIGVYAINLSSATTDATTVLPIEALGTHYTNISNAGVQRLTIIPPTPGTVFTIKNSAGTAVASNISLTGTDKEYTYYSSTDMTGYTVESDYPVAVFVSAQCGSPVTTGGCDHNFEQIFPTNTAGKNFFLWNLSPMYENSSTNTQDQVKILALEDGTVIQKKVGATTTTVNLDKHGVNTFKLDTAVRVDNSLAPVQLIADKPIIVGHYLGYAPTIKWWAPVEQRITQAVLTPFVPTTASVIKRHQLDIMIPAGSAQNMIVRETRNGVTVNVTPTFYTNTTDPNYQLTTLHYAQSDNVLIELVNPSGFVAYMTGYGPAESYIITAGAGAFDLQTYFTVQTKTQPYTDTYYTATTEATHSFEDGDNLSIKRTIEKPFSSVKWLVNGTQYTVTENTNINHSLTIPSSALRVGANTLTMSVRYNGTTADSLYVGSVWKANPVFEITPNDPEVCIGNTQRLTCGFTLSGTTTYQWQSSPNRSTWTDIQGATSSHYDLVSRQRGVVYYRVVLSNGSQTVYSEPARVKVVSCSLPVNHNTSVMGY